MCLCEQKKMSKRVNLMPYFCTINCPKLQSFWALRPLHPHQGSILDLLGDLQRPPTPSCLESLRIVPEARYDLMYAARYWPHFFSTKLPNFLYTHPKINKPAQNRKNCLKTRPKISYSSGLLHRGVTSPHNLS